MAMLVAIVVVPTPPLGLYTATVRRARCMVTPSVLTIGVSARERWKRSSRASTRASSSRASNVRAMTSSAPASRKLIRSSTSSVALTHMTGTAARAGVARTSRHSSTEDFSPPTVPRIRSWWSAAFANASSDPVATVTV